MPDINPSSESSIAPLCITPDVSCKNDSLNVASAKVTISEQAARRILSLAVLVKAQDLVEVTAHDFIGVEFFPYSNDEGDEEEDAGEGAPDPLRIECPFLIVTDQDYYFMAYPKHGDDAIQSKPATLADLAAHFNMAVVSPA